MQALRQQTDQSAQLRGGRMVHTMLAVQSQKLGRLRPCGGCLAESAALTGRVEYEGRSDMQNSGGVVGPASGDPVPQYLRANGPGVDSFARGPAAGGACGRENS